jgi:hypothetical protein
MSCFLHIVWKVFLFKSKCVPYSHR